jgi:precorrin-6B methylase 2
MRIPDIPASINARCLFGTFEMELHAAIERLIGGGLRTVINGGAGQGYYAVGLALRCPDARVIAFETLAEWRRYIRVAAELNHVADRITLREACTADTLRQCLGSLEAPALLIVDIEGNELALFDAGVAAQLSNATVLIETHDHHTPGTTQQLLARFAATHHVEMYAPQDRMRRDLPPTLSSGRWRALSWLLVWLIKESRAARQQWLLFTPREGAPVSEAKPKGRAR